MNEVERQVARYVDGDMDRDEQVAFEACVRDPGRPELQALVEEAKGLSGWFAPGRAEDGPIPPAGFRGRVLDAVRALPPADAASAAIERVARRMVYAAAAIVAAAVLTAVTLLGRPAGDGRLEASPRDVERAIELLDERIRAGSAADTEAPRTR